MILCIYNAEFLQEDGEGGEGRDGRISSSSQANSPDLRRRKTNKPRDMEEGEDLHLRLSSEVYMYTTAYG